MRLGAHHRILRHALLPECAPCPGPCCRSVSMASFGLLDKLRITGTESHWNRYGHLLDFGDQGGWSFPQGPRLGPPGGDNLALHPFVLITLLILVLLWAASHRHFLQETEVSWTL